MRTTLILLFALFAGTAFAQAPVIDSMLIDESKGILSVYGDFGAAQGKVWCDSVELPVLSWSASLVTATIPDTGKGSAGGVVVEDIGGVSEARFVTLWKGTIYDGHDESSITNEYAYYLKFAIRMDVHCIVKNNYKVDRRLLLNNASLLSGHYKHLGNGPGGQYIRSVDATVAVQNDSTNYSKGFMTDVRYNSDDRKFYISVKKVRGLVGTEASFGGPNYYEYPYTYNINDFDDIVSLDMGYDIIKSTYDNGSNLYHDWGGVSPIQVSFLPNKSIWIKNNPSIIAPENGRLNLGTDDAVLKWDTLKYMDAYHIQLSKDSLINGQRAGQAQQGVVYIVDTIVSSLDFALPPLEKKTKYYWRVCGVNTEGESRWSPVWSFTTGTSADVKQERAKSISLACYPNPATSELTIVTTEPTRLLLYDVTGEIVKSEQTTSSETKWDVSLLPNGTYILGTSSGRMQVVQIVK